MINPMTEQAMDSVVKAITATRSGQMVIMVDDEDRENEGDLVFAAESVTPELINFMAKEARGLICLTMEPGMVNALQLPMMRDGSKAGPSQSTAFTVSIEASCGVTTGISAHDRCHTIKVATHPNVVPNDVVVPGHVFPLKAREGGVLARAGHTEGSVDLAKLAGFRGAAVICEIMKDDGTMARLSDLEEFSVKHGIPLVSIADLITYRLHRESLVKEVAASEIVTSHGTFRARVFESLVDSTQHLALTNSVTFKKHDVTNVRVHTRQLLSDVFQFPQDNRPTIDYGLEMLNQDEPGILLYITPSENERSYAEQLNCYQNPQEYPAPTMDMRMHGIGAQILRHMGVQQMCVHSSSLKTMKGLSGFGLEIVRTEVIINQLQNTRH